MTVGSGSRVEDLPPLDEPVPVEAEGASDDEFGIGESEDDTGEGEGLSPEEVYESSELVTQPPATAHVPKRKTEAGMALGRASGSGMSAQQVRMLAVAVPMVLGVGLAARVLRKLFRRAKQDTGILCELEATMPPAAEGAPRPLEGVRLAVAENVSIEGVPTTDGVHAARAEAGPSEGSAPSVVKLLQAGATVVALTKVDELGCCIPDGRSPGNQISNPAAPGHLPGSGSAGAAAAVSSSSPARIADLALAVDGLGSALIPASACGAYALRPTAGTVPAGGCTGPAPAIDMPTLLAPDIGSLSTGAAALGAPGQPGLRGQLFRFLLCSDLLASVDADMDAALQPVKAAVLKWAGREQVMGVPLSNFLRDHVKAWTAFCDEEERKSRTAPMLAISRAAAVLRNAVQAERYGGDRAEAFGLSKCATKLMLEDVGNDQIIAARALLQQLQSALRNGLQGGTILVLPIIPGAPPPARKPDAADDEEAGNKELTWFSMATMYTSFISMSGCPCVTLPVRRKNGATLSVALVGLFKADRQLLAVAGKLDGEIKEAASALAKAEAEAKQTAEAGKKKDESKPTPKVALTEEGRKAAKEQATRAEAKTRAEAAKLKGNEAFKTGNYAQAIAEYSRAHGLDPKNPVFLSNRAMAWLKVPDYARAEADCDAALRLALNAKTLLRRGMARMYQNKLEGAIRDFTQVKALEPKNRQAAEELAKAKQMLSAFNDAGGPGGAGLGGTGLVGGAVLPGQSL